MPSRHAAAGREAYAYACSAALFQPTRSAPRNKLCAHARTTHTQAHPPPPHRIDNGTCVTCRRTRRGKPAPPPSPPPNPLGRWVLSIRTSFAGAIARQTHPMLANTTTRHPRPTVQMLRWVTTSDKIRNTLSRAVTHCACVHSLASTLHSPGLALVPAAIIACMWTTSCRQPWYSPPRHRGSWPRLVQRQHSSSTPCS